LLARLPEAARLAELGLSLEVDGSCRWARTIAGSTPGDTETLEYHCRLLVEPGRDVRLRARASLKKAALVTLSLQAVEEV
jgi:predicted Rdx family selenoprotein